MVVAAGGVLLPDARLTPGQAYPGVGASQVCVTGWSAAHRSVSDSERLAVFAEYGIPYATHSSYEVDHLIPLEIGGDNALANLWPEKGTIPNRKDALENRLRTLVCTGGLSLSAAQHAIATNWTTAYRTYLPAGPAPAAAPPAPRSEPPAPAPAPAPAPTTAPSPAGPPGGATARCNDGSYSFAAHHQGACSSHGGVAVFYR